MEIKVSFLDKLVGEIADWLKKDRRKELPECDVVIGRHHKTDLGVDICARIVLGEAVPPPPEIFLRRLYLGDPFCLRCLRPLDRWNTSWMADSAQIGYKCPSCGTEIEGDVSSQLDDAKGHVRRDLEAYWRRYREEIDKLIGGRKQEKFKLKGQ
jgi:hypothetical protein